MNARPSAHLPEITERQRQVARLISEGLTNGEIAERLGISLDGAKYHVSELLGRLGFERRRQIADWYRRESRTTTRRRLRALTGTWMAWAVGVGAMAAAAAVLLLLYIALGSTLAGGENDGPSVSPPSEATESPPIANAADINDILLLRPEETTNGPRGLYLIDATSGREFNFLPLDVAPMVVRRPSTNEVVVSDTISRPKPDGTSEAVTSVKVFDASLSALKREFPLPGRRMSYAVYAPAMELSLDEQTLWYIATSIRDAVECQGPSDAALCEVALAMAMDVDSGAILSQTELPRNCGYPSFNRMSARGMIVVCTNRATVLVLRQDGMVVASEDFGLAGGFEPEVTHKKGLARPRFGFEAPDGSLGVVLSSGNLLFRRPANSDPTVVPIAGSSFLVKSGGRVTSAPDGLIYIGLGTYPTNGTVERVAVFDTTTLTIANEFAVGDAVGFAPSRSAKDEFIAVRQDGSVDVVGIGGVSTARRLVDAGGALGTEVIP